MNRATCHAKLVKIVDELTTVTTTKLKDARARDMNTLLTVAACAAELRDLLPELGRAMMHEPSRLATSAGTVEVCT